MRGRNRKGRERSRWLSTSRCYTPRTLAHEPSPSPNAAKKRILVIDDARVVRSLLRHWLERLGYLVVEAQNGPQGLAAVDSGAIDLVICDINMPGLTGLTILDHVRKDPKLRSLPFVLLTTMGREEDMRRGAALGCSAYLTKPILFGRLVATLRDLLSGDAPVIGGSAGGPAR